MKRAGDFVAAIAAAAVLALAAPFVSAVEQGKTAAAKLSRDSHAALKKLYARVPLAKSLRSKAHAILVFP